MTESWKPREELLQVVEDINTSLGLTGMHLELASDERAQEMVDFLTEHFFPDETLSKSVGLVMNECRKKLLLERYKDNLSLLLVSDVTNQVIGVRTIRIIPAEGQTIDLSRIEDERIRKVLTFLRHKNSDMNVYKYFGADCAVNFINLGIHKDYRNKGLGSTLMKAAMLYVKDIGLEPVCITGEGTSNYSQKIYEKFGFDAIHTVKYKDYKVEGEVVFKNTGDNETCHVGISGNEDADMTAKQSLSLQESRSKLPYTEPNITACISSKWQSSLNNASFNKLHEIKPILGESH